MASWEGSATDLGGLVPVLAPCRIRTRPAATPCGAAASPRSAISPGKGGRTGCHRSAALDGFSPSRCTGMDAATKGFPDPQAEIGLAPSSWHTSQPRSKSPREWPAGRAAGYPPDAGAPSQTCGFKIFLSGAHITDLKFLGDSFLTPILLSVSGHWFFCFVLGGFFVAFFFLFALCYPKHANFKTRGRGKPPFVLWLWHKEWRW